MSKKITDELYAAAADFTAECRYNWFAQYRGAWKAAERGRSRRSAYYLETAFSWACALSVFCGICRRHGILERDLIEIIRATSGAMVRTNLNALQKNIWDVPEFPKISRIDDEGNEDECFGMNELFRGIKKP